MLYPHDVSLIVPVYNGSKNWARALDALAALQPPPGEIFIIDDGSTDDSASTALARGYTVLTSSQSRSGPAIARNLGAARAKGQILFFVDSD